MKPARLDPAPAVLGLALVLLGGCESGPTDPHGLPDGSLDGSTDLPGAVSAPVEAAIGATLETEGGIRLSIPPGALPADTTITVIPVVPLESDDRGVVAVRFEPDGLELSRPAMVSLPLPSDWDGVNEPLVLDFYGDDPTMASSRDEFAAVTGGPGSYRAEAEVSHFSGLVCAENCHAGTIKAILEHYAAEGCAADSILALVNATFPGVNVPADGCGSRAAEKVQAVLDTYFDDIGGFDEGEDVPPETLDMLMQAVRDGRQVALAFKAGQWGPRGGTHDFLPTSGADYSHSATLELVDGDVQIRNSIVVGRWRLEVALGGNTVHYPAADLNGFRRLRSGVANEIAVCGAPGCLGDETSNIYGIRAYGPLESRRVPWTAVRVYVEKDRYRNQSPCEEPTEGVFFAAAKPTVEMSPPIDCGQATTRLSVSGFRLPAEVRDGEKQTVEITLEWESEGIDLGEVEVNVTVRFFGKSQVIQRFEASGRRTFRFDLDTSHIVFQGSVNFVQIFSVVFADCIVGGGASSGMSIITQRYER